MWTTPSSIPISSRCLWRGNQPSRLRLTVTTTTCLHHRPRPSRGGGGFSPFCTSAGRRSWDPNDLRNVSDAPSPLVFHLTSDDPYQNLSLEHVLLTHSHPASHILLFYTNRPCVVIGRNQNPWLETDIKRLHAGLSPESEAVGSTKSLDRLVRVPIDLVRRRSGGGTVFHDGGNLNYSVIVPNDKTFKRSKHAEMVVRALAPLGPRYGFGEVKVNERNDIVMAASQRQQGQQRQGQQEWLKVSGSAFKLTKGRALHHGTLLFSSPNLDNISGLLRSPGRDLIHAKGVESVRSKVGNLAWTPDAAARRAVRQTITQAIVEQFWAMYGGGQTREPGRNELVLGAAECAASCNPSVAAGVAELQTDAWTFDQTPRFDFASGVVDGAQLKLQVNHGVMMRMELELDDGRHSVTVEQDALRSVPRFTGYEGRLLNVADWHAYLTAAVREATNDDVAIPAALVDRVKAVFPRRDGAP